MNELEKCLQFDRDKQAFVPHHCLFFAPIHNSLNKHIYSSQYQENLIWVTISAHLWCLYFAVINSGGLKMKYVIFLTWHTKHSRMSIINKSHNCWLWVLRGKLQRLGEQHLTDATAVYGWLQRNILKLIINVP